ncbi:MAG: hypothetical protein AAFX52_04225 [Pseudomonadota bacterium]
MTSAPKPPMKPPANKEHLRNGLASKAFNTSSAKERSSPSARKRPPPFSIRLSAAERAQLEEDAAGQPLGAHVKSILFAPTGKGAASRALTQHNRALLAQILAMIGASDVGEGLSSLGRAIETGTLKDEREIIDQLQKAEAELSEVRGLLLKALGLRRLG